MIVIQILTAVIVFTSLYSAFVILALKRPVRADEVHTVTTPDGWRIKLYRYTGKGDAASREPILVAHGANANQINLTTPQSESLVDLLSRNGFDCWCIEFRGCRSSEAPKGTNRFTAKVDDCVRHDIPAAIRYILEATEQPKLHCIGYSMGGMMLYAHAIVNGDGRIATMTTIGSPPGFDSVPELQKFAPVVKLAKVLPLPVEWAWRLLAPLYPSFKLNLPFAPVDWANMHKNAAPDVFYNVAELLPVDAAEHFLIWAQEGQPWQMMNGSVNVEEKLKQIALPILVITGKADPLTPVARVERFFEALRSRDKQLLIISRANHHVADYNHLDLVWGRDAERDVFRAIIRWLAAHPFEEGEQVEVIEHPQ